MTSHNRIDCARISQEIIKLNYDRPLPVVHASSSATYGGYLEDAFESCAAKSLHAGAINLLQTAIRLCVKRLPQVEYIVHLEADTWLMDEAVVERYIRQMQSSDALLATCAWSSPEPRTRVGRASRGICHLLGIPPARTALQPMRDFSTQFFIIRTDPRLIDAVLSIAPRENTFAEAEFYHAFTKHFGLDRVIRMIEREPVDQHRYWCHEQALYCQHWPTRGSAADPRRWWDPLYIGPHLDGKRETLQRYPNISVGQHLNRLLDADEFSYYNEGAIRY